MKTNRDRGRTAILIYKGVTITVEATQPGTPAVGRFNKGDIILGINGTQHQGSNPYVVLGSALTEAEATDGVLTFGELSWTCGDPNSRQNPIEIHEQTTESAPSRCRSPRRSQELTSLGHTKT